MESKILSIIITAYNVEKYINKNIDSILNQKKDDYEVIIVNDCSTDKTLNLINQYNTNDFILLNNESNKGISFSRNLALSIAKGKYISFIDGDDWVSQDYFKILLSNIHKFDFVICSYNRCYENKKNPRSLNINGEFNSLYIQKKMIGPNDSEFTSPDTIDSISSIGGKLYCNKTINNYGIKFEDLNKIGTGEDLLFNLMYITKIKNIFVIDKPLYQYRRDNQNSLTTLYKPNLLTQWENKSSIIKKIIDLENPILKNSLENRQRINIIGLGINEMANPKGYYEIIKNLNQILNNKNYKNIYKNIYLKKLPVHWRFFFILVKYKKTTYLYMLLKIIMIIIKKNK